MRTVLLLLLLTLGRTLPGLGAALDPEDAGEANRTRISERIRGQAIAAAHPPLDHPALRPVSSAVHMQDGDAVLGVVVSGQARAYPWWVAKNHHVVNDTIGGVPVAVSFCEQCTGAAAFRREVNGRVLTMEVPGIYNGTIILRDRETRTLWAPFSGKAIEGPLAGWKLDRIPLSLTRWDEWRSRHPESEVVWASPGARGGHGSWYEPGKWGIVSEMGATIQAWDPRLPENALVYGLEVQGTVKSYPLAEIRARKGVVNDEVAQTPVLVVAGRALDLSGFERRLDDRLLTFHPSPQREGVMADDQTGSVWSVEGQAVSGPLRGARLRALDGYLVEWHVWSAYNPQAQVFGGAAPAGPRVPGEAVFPSLTLEALEGGAPKALSFPAEVNLVALWSAWCPPCRVELPRLQALARKHSGQGLSVVGIAMHIPGDPMEKDVVRSFVAEAEVTFPTLLVDEPAYDRLEVALGGRGLVLPTVIVVDKGGRIQAVFEGKQVEDLPAALPGLLPRQPL